MSPIRMRRKYFKARFYAARWLVRFGLISKDTAFRWGVDYACGKRMYL